MKISYVSGTRADFGLLQQTLVALHADKEIDLEVIALGQHLDQKYGNTVQDIQNSGLNFIRLESTDIDGRDGVEMAELFAQQASQLSVHLAERKPDLLLLLGDRGEMLAAGISALYLGIPVAHFHGGERSGTVDDQIRHAVSSFAHYHFAATPGARERLLATGELSEHIALTGAPGLDEIRTFMPRTSVREDLNINKQDPITTILFHPVVQDAKIAAEQARTILETAAEHLSGSIVVLMPNSDAGSSEIMDYYSEAQKRFSNPSDNQPAFKWVTHLQRHDFLSLVATSDLLIGNSSSGIIEAASLRTATVNIGDRQMFRQRNDSVFDCDVKAPDLKAAIDAALTYRGQFGNIYDQGGCANRIVETIKGLDLSPTVLKKPLTL